MSEYQVLARKYRPQTFREVLGQDAIVTTLKNAIKHGRLAHAYLFCGSRGTGKTTLARVFAKSLNCQAPSSDFEPCNQCASCREITSGNSLDVLEIDGASHRGIDDIRQINDNVGYATSSGKYKIYIIDEVHMLTKEAFNALLKTLEEPPPKVKFFFATTEPHKVLPTILSRCQRFNLNRIANESIADKLRSIAKDLNVSIHEDAIRLLAARADGGLRDAESLLDQIIAFHEGEITSATIAEVLGIMPKEQLFELDLAGKANNLAFAFELAHQIFTQGKDITHFVENLTEHFRNILMVKLAGRNAPFLTLSETEREKYDTSAKLYSQEQCLTILDFLIEAQNQIRFLPTARIPLEALLMRIIRTHQRVPVDFLVKRLSEIEEKLQGHSQPNTQTAVVTPQPLPSASVKQEPLVVKDPVTPKASQEPVKKSIESLTEDPTPSLADLGIKPKAPSKVDLPKAEPKKEAPPQPSPQQPRAASTLPPIPPTQQNKYDTILQFAAIELEGTIQKKQLR